MRLIQTEKLQLEEFVGNDIPPYAILSHTWGSEEITFDDFQMGCFSLDSVKKRSSKIDGACRQTRTDGLHYIWIDTCCIDKSSSAELNEAINSMYNWYEKSSICYAYLEDVSSNLAEDAEHKDSEFRRARWFTRGWTLQELLAPLDLVFFNNQWGEIASKAELSRILTQITYIPEHVLRRSSRGARTEMRLDTYSIVEKMSWASERVTTRVEDIAYCLLGLLNVSLPILYGEGSKAFTRLQEAVIKQTTDQSILAWRGEPGEQGARSERPILAQNPAQFRFWGTGGTRTLPNNGEKASQRLIMSKLGITMWMPLINSLSDRIVFAVLNCETFGHLLPAFQVCMPLWKTEDGAYRRIEFPQQTLVMKRLIPFAGVRPSEIFLENPPAHVTSPFEPSDERSVLTKPLTSLSDIGVIVTFPNGKPASSVSSSFPVLKMDELGILWLQPRGGYFYGILSFDAGSNQPSCGIFFAVAADWRAHAWTCRVLNNIQDRSPASLKSLGDLLMASLEADEPVPESRLNFQSPVWRRISQEGNTLVYLEDRAFPLTQKGSEVPPSIKTVLVAQVILGIPSPYPKHQSSLDDPKQSFSRPMMTHAKGPVEGGSGHITKYHKGISPLPQV